MANRSRLVLAVAVVDILLFALAIAGLIVRSSSAGTATLLSIDPLRLVAVHIAGQRGEIVLERTDDNWTLSAGNARFPVRDDRIALLKAAIVETNTVRRVSREAAEPVDLGFGSGARAITLRTDRQSETLVMGVLGDAVYGREGGQDTVYELRTDLPFYMDQPAEFWLPLRVFPGAADATSAISLRYEAAGSNEGLGSQSFDIVLQSDGQWVERNSLVEVDRVAAGELVSAIVELIGDGLTVPEAVSDSPVAGSIRVGLSNGQDYEATLFELAPSLVGLNGPGSNPPTTAGFIQLVRRERIDEILSRSSGL